MTKVIWALIGALTLVLIIDIAASAWMSHFISKKEKALLVSQIDRDIDSILVFLNPDDSMANMPKIWVQPQLKLEIDPEKKLIAFIQAQSHQINDQLKISWEAIYNQYGSVSLHEINKTAGLVEIYQKYSPYTLDPLESELLETCKNKNQNRDGDYFTKIDIAENCYTGLRTIKRKLDMTITSNK